MSWLECWEKEAKYFPQSAYVLNSRFSNTILLITAGNSSATRERVRKRKLRLPLSTEATAFKLMKIIKKAFRIRAIFLGFYEENDEM
jgi:hypothetical protein